MTRWTHLPQLDGLRALAVAAVLVSHFGLGHRLERVVEAVDWGHLGVRLFFVLSGFLITRLLLERRRAVQEAEQAAPDALRRFYVRRVLRIFPIFYLTLFVAGVVGYGAIRTVLPWHMAYLSNFQSVMYAGEWTLRDPTTQHFWSLAVEEQFYLFWPALILFLPERRLVAGVIAMVIAATAWRAGWFQWGSKMPSGHLPACLDTLGTGSLLAMYKDGMGQVRRLLEPRLRLLLITGILFLAAVIGAHVTGRFFRPHYVLIDVGEAIVFAFVVGFAADSIPGPIGKFLEAPPVRYLGKISYGVYVVHAFMSPLQAWIFSRLHWASIDGSAFQALLRCAMTIGVASLSWFLIEQPLSRLKDRISRDAPVEEKQVVVTS